MVEVLGNSSRGMEFALVRLTVDGDRIVAADAPGIERPLDGLTLLEAAAVGGESSPSTRSPTRSAASSGPSRIPSASPSR